MNRFFRLMNAPLIETSIVTTSASGTSMESDPSLVVNIDRTFIISSIIAKNITKTMKKIIDSVTVMSVFSLWRFNPKKPPSNVCHAGEIVMVSFHGFSLN